MAELQDYSGEFKPDLKMQDFSKDRLVELWRAASRFFVAIDGLWWTFIKEKFGEETANEWDSEIWMREMPLEFNWVRQSGNITGDDVASILKFFQIDPGVNGVMELECELKNKNHGILTVKSCRPLGYYERHPDSRLQRGETPFVCGLDVATVPIVAHMADPRIKVNFPKLPPRKSKDEICCQWEFKIEE